MSLFRKSSDIPVYDKILVWGPQETGKTHFSFTFPGVAYVDTENRGAHFSDRFDFLHAGTGTIAELGEVFKEIRAGRVPCETVVVDSYSAIYGKLVVEHTSKASQSDKHVTDYTTVNKRIEAVRDFAFSIADKNVIFLAHSKMKYRMDGNQLKPNGFDFVGDPMFRYAFDYVFQLVSNGDPRTKPATFVVEKSASPNLLRGTQIVGLDYAKFKELTTPKRAVDLNAPITQEEVDALESFAAEVRIANSLFVDHTKAASGGRTVALNELTKGEGRKLYKSLLRFREHLTSSH